MKPGTLLVENGWELVKRNQRICIYLGFINEGRYAGLNEHVVFDAGMVYMLHSFNLLTQLGWNEL